MLFLCSYYGMATISLRLKTPVPMNGLRRCGTYMQWNTTYTTHKIEQNNVVCSNVDATRDSHTK